MYLNLGNREEGVTLALEGLDDANDRSNLSPLGEVDQTVRRRALLTVLRKMITVSAQRRRCQKTDAHLDEDQIRQVHAKIGNTRRHAARQDLSEVLIVILTRDDLLDDIELGNLFAKQVGVRSTNQEKSWGTRSRTQ